MTSIHPTQENLIPGQPPSAQEIQRKLSVAQRKGKSRATVAQNSGTDTEDESSMIPTNDPNSAPMGASASQPLSAIAERTGSGVEESEEDDDDVAGGWRPAKSVDHSGGIGAGTNTTVIHSGYLWKKGSGRRKTWKKRWFVLRPTHLACYKTSAEYKLMRLLDISDIHAATPVQLKRHPNACGIVTQGRTFYFQAEASAEIDQWVTKINAAKEALQTSSVPGTPVVIPPSGPITEAESKKELSAPPKPPTTISLAIPPASPTVVFTQPSSPISAVASPSRNRAAQASNTSSDSEDGATSGSPMHKSPRSPSRDASGSKDKEAKDIGKPVLSGYLMKCGGRRKIWRKRWFILTQNKLVYMGSHMETKPHRQIMLNQVLDAMEYRPAPANHNHRHTSPHRAPGDTISSALISPGETSALPKGTSQAQTSNLSAQTPVEPYLVSGVNYTFKVITPKKTLLLCAPSEEEEVNWISAIRVLIARRTKEKEAEAAGAMSEEGKKGPTKAASASRAVPETPTTGAPKNSVTIVTA